MEGSGRGKYICVMVKSVLLFGVVVFGSGVQPFRFVLVRMVVGMWGRLHSSICWGGVA